MKLFFIIDSQFITTLFRMVHTVLSRVTFHVKIQFSIRCQIKTRNIRRIDIESEYRVVFRKNTSGIYLFNKTIFVPNFE